MQIIRKNFALKLLALAIAILGWAYFRFANNPLIAARFDQQISVPIVAANLPSGYIVRFSAKEAVVTVGVRRNEPPVKPDEIKAVLDLSNKTTGVYNVPVQLVAPAIVVQSLSPASVSLTIERIGSERMSPSIHYPSRRPRAVVVGSSSISPKSVTIHGPTDALAQVATVRVDLSIPNAPSAFDAMLRPVAVDSLGNPVPGVDVAPDLLRVTITFVAGSGASTK